LSTVSIAVTSHSDYDRTVNARARPVDQDSLFDGSVSASADVLMQKLPDEESIFLDLRTESYFGLDSVGSRMYAALIEAPTVRQAYERLSEEFEVEPERLRNDFVRFVERLIDQGLLVFHAVA
jgi:hypothetical protein